MCCEGTWRRCAQGRTVPHPVSAAQPLAMGQFHVSSLSSPWWFLQIQNLYLNRSILPAPHSPHLGHENLPRFVFVLSIRKQHHELPNLYLLHAKLNKETLQLDLGTDDGTKTDEFSEKFLMAFDPPLTHPLELFWKFIRFGAVTRPLWWY